MRKSPAVLAVARAAQPGGWLPFRSNGSVMGIVAPCGKHCVELANLRLGLWTRGWNRKGREGSPHSTSAGGGLGNRNAGPGTTLCHILR